MFGAAFGAAFGAGLMTCLSRIARLRRSGVSTYSHTRPVLVHFRHEGYVSSHFLRRILESDILVTGDLVSSPRVSLLTCTLGSQSEPLDGLPSFF